MDFQDYYYKLNSQATNELKKLVKGIKNIHFTSEQKDGFYLETPKGTFWFQCETVDLR